MAKKFMYVCIGIMALAVTFHVGAMYGRAETIVDHSSCGIVAVETGHGAIVANVLLDNGEVWRHDANIWEQYLPRYEPPIPRSEIKFWTLHCFVSSSNELWYYMGGGGWINFGPPPGGVATEPSTWGKLKSEWGE